MTCEAVQVVPRTLVYWPFFKTLNLARWWYAFRPLGSLNFGALVLPTLPVYKIMALICSSVRSLECLTGFWGLGIASVSRNWGAKGGEVRKKTQVREAAFVFALSKPNQRKEGPFSLSCSKSERALFPSPNMNNYKHKTYYKSGDPKKRTRTFEMMTGHDYH